MTGPLEAPDARITFPRAAELAGLSLRTLQQAASSRRLVAEQPGRDWFTTRRDLHHYLMNRSRGRIAPLPAGYAAPEGEE